jgi:hypothetical protein
VAPRPRRWTVWGVVLTPVFAVAFGLLVFLSTQAVREPPVAVQPTPTPDVESDADFPERVASVTAAIERMHWPLSTAREQPKAAGTLHWTYRHYELTVPSPDPVDSIDAAVAPLAEVAPGVTTTVTHGALGADVAVGVDGLLTHRITFRWLGRQPRTAFIVDDVGNDLLAARSLAELDTPLAFAVAPERPFAREVVTLAGLYKHEVVIDLIGRGGRPPSSDAPGLMQAGDRQAVDAWLDDALALGPAVLGVTNHLDPDFSTDPTRMLWLIQHLKGKQLFIIDGGAVPGTVTCDVAKALTLPCLRTALTLVDTDDPQALRAQLVDIPKLALAQGDVIVVAHARPTTVAAISTARTALTAAEVQVVPLSTVVADLAAAPR